jgi:hypothetical protein
VLHLINLHSKGASSYGNVNNINGLG